MSFDTYNELLDQIRLYSDKDSDPNWRAALPGFPALVEAQVRKRLRLGEQERTAILNTASTKSAYTLPPRTQRIRYLGYQGRTENGQVPEDFKQLNRVSPQEIERYRTALSTGPRDYCLMDGQIVIAGPPETGGNLKLLYYEGILPLSTTNPSNWLLADYPDIYFNGSMVESLKFQKGDDLTAQRQEYAEAFRTELAQLAAMDITDRWTGNPDRKTRALKW